MKTTRQLTDITSGETFEYDCLKMFGWLRGYSKLNEVDKCSIYMDNEFDDDAHKKILCTVSFSDGCDFANYMYALRRKIGETAIRIGGIKNSWGEVYISKCFDRNFWCVSDSFLDATNHFSEADWQEIPEDLYQQLIKKRVVQ